MLCATLLYVEGSRVRTHANDAIHIFRPGLYGCTVFHCTGFPDPQTRFVIFLVPPTKTTRKRCQGNLFVGARGSREARTQYAEVVDVCVRTKHFSGGGGWSREEVKIETATKKHICLLPLPCEPRMMYEEKEK